MRFTFFLVISVSYDQSLFGLYLIWLVEKYQTLNAIAKTEKKINAFRNNSICDQAWSDNVVEVTPAT